MKVTLNKTEYRAVNDLRGLPPDAHLMVMCSRFTPTGGVLEGSEEAFDELLDHISEDLAEGMVKGAKARALVSVCAKINPDSLDWLGK